MNHWLEKQFHLSDNKTNIKTEIVAGLTTFLTMAYIIFIQPTVLATDFIGKPTGIDFGSVILATCLASALTTIFMGLYANYPIALAPGMGENFFFVSVIMSLTAFGKENAWQIALGIVFISGIIFLILSILPFRETLINAISPSLKNAIATGIGLFIAFIGLRNGGLIIGKAGTLVGLNNNFLCPEVAVFFFGLITTSVLYILRVKGPIILGIVAGYLMAIALGKAHLSAIFGFPTIETYTLFKMDIRGALNLVCLPYIIVFVFMDVFDTTGTLIGVSEQAGFIKDNTLPRANKALVVDSAGTILGACLGTSTITSYIESATGVAQGGRTGLTSIVTGLLFILALCCGPLISSIGQYTPITAPALVIVGILMIQNVKKIDWHDYSEAIPSFMIMIGIPFSYSIADGLSLGFICYPIIKLLSGKGKQIHPFMYVLALILIGYFICI
ncbi:MAG: NCS2 family permease, partial [Chlamydiota bacterium]|nr:NCS2 family permease [Chlamydiota bacterium]